MMRWERLAALRAPVLMLLAILVLIGGVGTGVFLLSVAAGWITVGVLGFAALAFLAYVVDTDVQMNIPVSPAVGLNRMARR
jgi:hypothetical protein